MAVALFILFWVLIAVAIVFIGLRGGARGARDALQTQNRVGRRFTVGIIAVIIVAFGIVLPAVLLIGNEDHTGRKYQSLKLTQDDAKGRTIFAEQCSSCHTLNAAHAAGKVGPNLDQLNPPKALVLDALAHGRQRGNGTMPALLVTGQDAQDVAAFVAATAGQGGGTAKPPSAIGNDGKAIFQSQCASCHTLKAANASGTIGPNLDTLKPPLARVQHQVEVGGGVMPAFKGKLTAQQIQAVAKFVADSAGK